jgi:hypothetical protein
MTGTGKVNSVDYTRGVDAEAGHERDDFFGRMEDRFLSLPFKNTREFDVRAKPNTSAPKDNPKHPFHAVRKVLQEPEKKYPYWKGIMDTDVDTDSDTGFFSYLDRVKSSDSVSRRLRELAKSSRIFMPSEPSMEVDDSGHPTYSSDIELETRLSRRLNDLDDVNNRFCI